MIKRLLLNFHFGKHRSAKISQIVPLYRLEKAFLSGAFKFTQEREVQRKSTNKNLTDLGTPG